MHSSIWSGAHAAFPIPEILDGSALRLINDYAITAIMSTPTLILKLLFELRNE